MPHQRTSYPTLSMRACVCVCIRTLIRHRWVRGNDGSAVLLLQSLNEDVHVEHPQKADAPPLAQRVAVHSPTSRATKRQGFGQGGTNTYTSGHAGRDVGGRRCEPRHWGTVTCTWTVCNKGMGRFPAPLARTRKPPRVEGLSAPHTLAEACVGWARLCSSPHLVSFWIVTLLSLSVRRSRDSASLSYSDVSDGKMPANSYLPHPPRASACAPACLCLSVCADVWEGVCVCQSLQVRRTDHGLGRLEARQRCDGLFWVIDCVAHARLLGRPHAQHHVPHLTRETAHHGHAVSEGRARQTRRSYVRKA
jgi:hypothetical protein